MHVKSVLNRVHKIKGFVHERVYFVSNRVRVDIRPG